MRGSVRADGIRRQRLRILHPIGRRPAVLRRLRQQRTGAVGIRLDYYDTNFCFVTAHLAAGHTNVEERNTDYRTIANGLHFLRGKTIDSHQYDRL